MHNECELLQEPDTEQYVSASMRRILTHIGEPAEPRRISPAMPFIVRAHCATAEHLPLMLRSPRPQPPCGWISYPKPIPPMLSVLTLTNVIAIRHGI